MSISLRLSNEDATLFKNYAALHNISVSEMIRQTVLEHIESEFDLQAFADYEKDKAAGTLVTRPIDELWKDLDL